MNSKQYILAEELLPDMEEYLSDGFVGEEKSALFRFLEKQRRSVIDHPVIYVEDSISAKASGNENTLDAILAWSENQKSDIRIVRTGSLGFYGAQPVIGIHLPGRNRLFFSKVQDFQVDNLLNAVFKQFVPQDNLLGQWGDGDQIEWEGLRFLHENSFFAGQNRRVMRLNGIIDPNNILEYIAWGGYHGFAKSIKYYSHNEIANIVSKSKLRGRSGSGFPAHLKWQKAISVTAQKKIVICNADESDPGGYMHRCLIEGNPHLIIEGLMLAAYAIGASEAIIHTRSRYTTVVERLENAIQQVRQLKLSGQDILGSGFTLDIKLSKGPGAYVCGEETALIASLEGKRGMPRPKPPYPAEIGLNGKPTLVHNVETLAQIPLIIEKGPKWYRSIGTEECAGTKLFSLSGRFEQKGVLEVPFGYSLGALFAKNAKGVSNQREPKAILAGGLSGKFISPKNFDISLDYESFNDESLVLGSGSLVLLDEKSCPVDLVHHLMQFIQKESCGKCIPCREGTKRMADTLDMITHRPQKEKNHQTLHRFKGVTQLAQLAKVISETSLCGLGKGAPNPLLSALELFREEFEDHVFDRFCLAGVCQDLRTYHIDPEACTGCYVCFSKCPEQAIIGSPRQVHVIVTDRCTGCGKCEEVCKFDAISTL